jgi:hypothetical protein
VAEVSLTRLSSSIISRVGRWKGIERIAEGERGCEAGAASLLTASQRRARMAAVLGERLQRATW